ncbi:MAG TPA: YibL family ribosome-associated protein [Cellvibrionaceae bacterium]
MNLKEELQQLNHKLDKSRRKLAAATNRADALMIGQFTREITALTKQIESVKAQQSRQVGSKGEAVKALAFHRVLTKAEQADMGKLKKSVKGLVVVHPLTALGRELGVTEVTGFAPKAF